jgi:hypothetical protein
MSDCRRHRPRLQRLSAQASAAPRRHLDRRADLFSDNMPRNRRPLLARDEVAEILIDQWRTAHERHGGAIGRYVIMPDQRSFLLQT